MTTPESERDSVEYSENSKGESSAVARDDDATASVARSSEPPEPLDNK